MMRALSLACLLLAFPAVVRLDLDFGYHDYVALHDYLLNVSVSYPAITHLHSIGKSVAGWLIMHANVKWIHAWCHYMFICINIIALANKCNYVSESLIQFLKVFHAYFLA